VSRLTRPDWSHQDASRGLRLSRAMARALSIVQPRVVREQYGDAFPDVAEDRWRREVRAGASPIRATTATIGLLFADALKSVAARDAAIDQQGAEGRSGPPRRLDGLNRHVRQAWTGLVRNPLMTAVATVSLAIGIGANVAVFNVADALLMARTPGIADPDRLVDIGRTTSGRGFDTVSYVTYQDLRDRNSTLSGLYATRGMPAAVSIGVGDGVERAYAEQVSASFFDVLGVQPVAGSVFHATDEHLGVPLRRVVLSYAYWRSRFAGDRAIAGRPVSINGDAFVITGITPEGFHGTTILAPDLWLPLTSYARGTPRDESLRSRESSWLIMGGRLKPGETVARAQTDLSMIQRDLTRAYPDIYGTKGLAVAPMSRVPGDAHQFVVPFVGVLMTLTGLVLLVTCANLAGVLLARGAARTREVAVRLALGASRGSLVAMFFTEAVVLCLPGALAAIAVARGSMTLLSSLLSGLPVPISADLSVDWRVAGFAAALSLVTAAATGLIPALQSSRGGLVIDLKSDAGAPRRQRIRTILVTAQIACCLLLMAAAGLLVRGLGAAARVDPGFRIDGIDIADVTLELGGIGEDRRADATARLVQRLAAVPGVDDVSVAAVVPLIDNGMSLGSLRKLDDPASEARIDADWNVISPGFLKALRLPMVAGRNFTDDDRRASLPVVIINERLARDLWPGQNPVGQVLETGDFRPGRGKYNSRLTIVGVARDAKYRSLGEETRQFIYVPLAQNPLNNLHIFLTRSDRLDATSSLAAEVRQALREVNPNLPLIDLEPFRQTAGIGLLPQRIAAAMAGALGGVALALSVIGVYGITAFAVASRTREIGIRMALGAASGPLLRLVMRQAIWLAGIGSAIGLAATLGLSGLLTSLLFGVSPLDPIALVSTTLALIAAATVAAWLPARRAAHINPVRALRAE